MSLDRARLERLLDYYLDERLSPEEKLELEQMLRAEPEARQVFWQHARFHALLREAGAEHRGRELAEVAEPEPWWRGLNEVPALVRTQAGWIAAVAAILIAVAIVRWPRVQNEPVRDRMTTGIAVLAQAVDLEWAPGAEPHTAGAPLSPGWLKIQSGLAQIEFSEGARLIVEGPAEVKLVSRSEAYCQSGRLSAQVPAAAHGFRISSPRMTVVDLGTAFGFEARPEGAAVHVFEGKVKYGVASAEPTQELVAGQAMGIDTHGAWQPMVASNEFFPNADALERRAARAWQRRNVEWRQAADVRRQEPSLLLQYSFEGDSPFERRLRNEAGAGGREGEGAIVGCRWAEGRWPSKRALEFKGITDRVRIEVPGTFDAVTFAAWVRVDSLDHKYNSLLMADGFDRGRMHWQITKGGAVKLGIGGSGDYDTPVMFPPERLGQWVHLALTVDMPAGRVRHYVDGQEVASLEIKKKAPLSLDRAEIGNWNPDTRKDSTPIRNFNGRMDEMLVFRRALSSEEVRGLSRNGPSPQLASQ